MMQGEILGALGNEADANPLSKRGSVYGIEAPFLMCPS